MRELSIYIHIPFCVRKCLYCDFLSAPADKGKIQDYVNLMLREIKEQSVFYRDYRVISLFFGGGTPSLLSADDTSRILEQVQDCYNMAADAEITIECNPGTATPEKLKNYITCGINRLSIGLQSADDEELARIGRIHGYSDFLKTYENARAAGFDNINIDLMAALPGQSVDSYRWTLERVIGLSPAHISAYSLILEEGTKLYVNQSDYTFPTEEEDREMYALTGAYLAQAGYQRYEISNYAREGFACRHNQIYWRRGDYVGFGLGASSLVQNVRWRNPQTHETYAGYVDGMSHMADKGGGMPGRTVYGEHAGVWLDESPAARMRAAGAEEVQALTTEEQMEEFMFLGLRLMEGVDRRRFRQMFGKSIEEVYGAPIEKFTAQGLLEQRGERLRLTPRGIDVSNAVFVEFLL